MYSPIPSSAYPLHEADRVVAPRLKYLGPGNPRGLSENASKRARLIQDARLGDDQFVSTPTIGTGDVEPPEDTP
jgi:hypothetical protein